MNVKPNPMSPRDFVLWLHEYFDMKQGDEVSQGDLELIGANLTRTKDLLDATEETLATSSGFTAPPPASPPVRTGEVKEFKCDDDCPFCF